MPPFLQTVSTLAAGLALALLPAAAVPIPDVTAPLPAAAVPIPNVTVPNAAVTVPNPAAAVPIPDLTAPLPAAAVPLPDVTAPPPAAGPTSGGVEVAIPQSIGTVEATLDGEARIWYVVSGEAGGQRQPGAFWMRMGPDERMAVVGGFDTEDFDYSGVELQGGMPVSLGSYEGSMVSISFPLEEGDAEGSWPLPGANAAVTYVADAGAMDFSSMLVLQEGVVETTRVQTDGPCRFEGRFSGTLRPMGGEGDSVEIRDGTFRVEGCEELTAG